MIVCEATLGVMKGALNKMYYYYYYSKTKPHGIRRDSVRFPCGFALLPRHSRAS